MMRALFAAISGLRGHQLFMDVVGNNLANVNTTGYKASRATFSDLLSQTLSSGSAPTATLGGINSKQVGLGSQIASIDILQAQGSLQTTGKATDIAIQGDGFFIVSNGSRQFYTRDGSFDIDSSGFLVSPATGMKVQGWNADASGAINTGNPIEALRIPIGQQTVAQPTGFTAVDTNGDTFIEPGENPGAVFNGNLDSQATIGSQVTAGLTVVDSLGAQHTITIRFTKTGLNPSSWNVAAYTSDTAIDGTVGTIGTPQALGSISFTANGAIVTTSPPAAQGDTGVLKLTVGPTDDTGATFGNATFPNEVFLDFSKLTGLAATSEVSMISRDGFTAGTLQAFKLDAQGKVVGIYSNGFSQNLGQMALATFLNPGGLTRAGNNLFEESSSSGAALIGPTGTGGRGTVSGGTLESSNVDLSREFTNMIIGQRGFQANARTISTSDEMLQELVNLRR